VRENRTPVPSLARSDSTTELPPHVSTERAAGIEPASTVWKTVALPLDDARLNWFQSISRFPSSCSRELHSPSPAYQAGAPLTGPEQQWWSDGESNPDPCRAKAVFSRLNYRPIQTGKE
jgi:hypothetical protein